MRQVFCPLWTATRPGSMQHACGCSRADSAAVNRRRLLSWIACTLVNRLYTCAQSLRCTCGGAWGCAQDERATMPPTLRVCAQLLHARGAMELSAAPIDHRWLPVSARALCSLFMVRKPRALCSLFMASTSARTTRTTRCSASSRIPRACRPRGPRRARSTRTTRGSARSRPAGSGSTARTSRTRACLRSLSRRGRAVPMATPY